MALISFLIIDSADYLEYGAKNNMVNTGGGILYGKKFDSNGS